MWHAILDNFRPITIWATQLAIYGLTDGAHGEKWSNGSYLQLVGLAVMLLALVRVCCGRRVCGRRAKLPTSRIELRRIELHHRSQSDPREARPRPRWEGALELTSEVAVRAAHD